MKQIPNLITLLNLFFGCCSIVTTLTAYPYYIIGNQDNVYLQIFGMQDIYWGAIFILLAACMDALDGLVARVLKAESPLGAQLDSLADVISFGVAPAMILYQMLWYSYVTEPDALEKNWSVMLPAFIIPCLGAYRLAKFNTKKSVLPKNYFLGLPIPATGMFIASLPMLLLFETDFLGKYFANRWVLYGIIILFGFLMISNVKFRKWNSGIKNISAGWPIYFVALVFLVTIFIKPYAALFFTMLTYLLVSLFVPYKSLDEKSR